MAEQEDVVTMSDEVAEQPQGKQETDWKAEARKWEARAKKSAAAELELEALKQAQMTEQEKATKRAEDAERQLAELQAENQRLADADELASKTGVPANLLRFCTDRESMEAFAKEYMAGQLPVHSAATAAATRIIRNDDIKPPSNGDMFADAVAGLF